MPLGELLGPIVYSGDSLTDVAEWGGVALLII